MTDKPANSADKYAASYPASLETIKGQDVIITNAHLIEQDNFGRPAYVMSIVIRATGETGKVKGNQQLIRDSIENMIADKAFPVEAHFFKQGKAWQVRGWQRKAGGE